MKTFVFFSGLLFICAIASAQMPTARGTTSQPTNQIAPAAPGACSPCLWYSGDPDQTNPLYDGLWNNNNINYGPGAVYVPFVPAPDGNSTHLHVLISSVTFTLMMNTPNANPPADYAGSTYEFRTKEVHSGSGGTLGRHGTCNSSVINYSYGPDFYGYNVYNVTCFFTTPVKVAVGTIGWVNVLPKFTGSTVAYLVGATDVPPLNQSGWSDDFYNSFWNSAYWFASWVPATTAGTGYQEFSVAIGGTYTL